MENEHVLSGLIRKRAEIGGALEAAQQRVRQLIIDIDNVDATIRLFAPEFVPAGIKPKAQPPRHAALKGEIGRAIMDALRGMGEAQTTKEIALRVMEARCLSSADPRFTWMMQKRVGAALRHMRMSGRVRSDPGKAGACLWKLSE